MEASRVSHPHAVRRWHPYSIHLFKAVFESSYECIFNFVNVSLYFILCSYVKKDICDTFFVAWKIHPWKRLFLIID